MEETTLYTARVQMVEAMEQGLPWQEATKRAGIKISQSTAIGSVSACVKGVSKRYAKAGMDIPANCEAKCANGWNRPVSELPRRQATRSKCNWPSVLAFK